MIYPAPFENFAASNVNYLYSFFGGVECTMGERCLIYLIPFFIEIVILLLLSRFVSKALSGFTSINFLSVIFLPGIVVHELSHLFMAMVLFVPVGNMEFIPKRDGDAVKLGSVEIAKTDPMRRAVIGFAPVFAGLIIVIGAVFLFSSNLLFFQNQNPYVFIAVILVLIYLLFAVGNTMFSSSRDMEGTVEIAITFLIIFAAIYILGFRPALADLNKIFTPHPVGAGFTKEIIGVIQQSTIFLLAPIAIDIVILGMIRVFRKI